MSEFEFNSTRAYEFAKRKHTGQVDDCGEDYFSSHVVQVGLLICGVTDDPDICDAALLHDTIEDTQTTYEELKEIFGHRVADLVLEVTHEGKPDNKGYYFPRLKSKEAIMIKFADRLSNLSRMGSWSAERQDHYLRKSKFWKSELK